MWDESPSFDARLGRQGQQSGYDGYDSFDDQGDLPHNGELPMTPVQQQNTYGGIRQMEQTSMSSAWKRKEASIVNPYAALHQINRELMVLGLPSPLMLPELPEFLEDNQRVVECLTTLLHQRKRDIDFRETMDSELRTAMGEEDVLRSTIVRLERELDQSQREAAMNRVKWEDSERNCSESEAQRKRLAAELRTTRSNAAMVKAQFMHDGKRREQESIKLKDRLQKLITDKHRTAKLSVELLNPIIRDRSGRPVEPTINRDRKLLEELIGRYEVNESHLGERIETLEKLLRRLSAALARLHGDVVSDVESEEPAAAAHNGEGAKSIDGDVTEDIGMSLDFLEAIRDRVRLDRSQQPAMVDQSELDERDRKIAELRAEIERLQQEIARLNALLEEQKRTIDVVANKHLDKVDMLEMSFSEMNMEQLDAERDAVRREKNQLEHERQRFIEAAVELGNERTELKKEREEFEQSKVQRGTSDLVQGLPPTPQWMKGIDTSQATPMILNQLQGMYEGTPTNALLASMAAGAAYNAAMATITPGAAGPTLQPHEQQQHEQQEEETKAPEDDFPEITSASSPPSESAALRPQHHTTMTSKRTTVRPSHSVSRASADSGLFAARTPVRPTPTRTPADIRSGRQPRTCTRPGCAAHAPHTHEDGTAAPVMELKPAVPRFRRAKADTDTSGSQSRPRSSATLPTQHRSAKTSAADIFK
ncbi:hypothetical protein H4R24_003938 [Coemansia sp. RSA 988]|nr:hypothetical protein H4R24_003938 [Coemansia sp. RSA 988]